jgi:phosphate-selective porin OprO/OprP
MRDAWSLGTRWLAAALIMAVAGPSPAPGEERAPRAPSGSAAWPLPGLVEPLPPVEAPVAALEAVALEAEAGGHPILLQATWQDGLWFHSPGGNFRLHVGGNAQWDSTWLIAPDSVFAVPGGGANGTENAPATLIRRARLRLEGDTYDQFDYTVEYEFANADNDNGGIQAPSNANVAGSIAPCNVWMQFRDVPLLGNVRLGHQVKPIGMTNNTYQGNLPFMERADNMDAFYGPFDKGFVTGLTSVNWSESQRVTWRYGVARPLANVFGEGIGHFLVCGRATALPWYDDDGRSLMHVGFGATYGDLVENELRVRARPLLRNGPGYAVPVLVDTGEVPGSHQCIVAPELAWVIGSLTIQAEWAAQFLTDAVVNGAEQGTVFYHGGYVQALYFLTGEHQAYERREGVFGRVVPVENYRFRRGETSPAYGAWQAGVRFSYLDLNDKAVQGGQVYDWTVGLNWFLSPSMKLQFNYILEHRQAPQDVVSGWISGLGAEAAYVF